GSALVVSQLTRNHAYVVAAQVACIIYITTFIQWTIGGIFDSGFVMAWALCGPIAALLFYELRTAFVWFGLFLLNVLVTAIFDPVFVAHGHVVPNAVRVVFFAMNLCVSSTVVFLFAAYFVTTGGWEKRRAQELLLSILPAEIAPRLK